MFLPNNLNITTIEHKLMCPIHFQPLLVCWDLPNGILIIVTSKGHEHLVADHFDQEDIRQKFAYPDFTIYLTSTT